LANNSVKLHARDLKLVFNRAIRTLAKAGVFDKTVIGTAEGIYLETMARYQGCGQATRTVRIKDKQGREHAIEGTVHRWKVLLLIDAATKIPLSVKVEKITSMRPSGPARWSRQPARIWSAWPACGRSSIIKAVWMTPRCGGRISMRSPVWCWPKRFQVDAIAQVFDPAHEAIHRSVPAMFVKIVGTPFVIQYLAHQPIGGDRHGIGYSYNRPFLLTAGRQVRRDSTPAAHTRRCSAWPPR
jgi:hypothetical protein